MELLICPQLSRYCTRVLERHATLMQLNKLPEKADKIDLSDWNAENLLNHTKTNCLTVALIHHTGCPQSTLYDSKSARYPVTLFDCYRLR